MTALSQSENGGKGLPPYRTPTSWEELVSQLHDAGDRFPKDAHPEVVLLTSSLLSGLLDTRTPIEDARKTLRWVFNLAQREKGPRDHQDKMGTAYHEAGHAVVGRVLGFKPVRVSAEVQPNHLALGVVEFEARPLTDATAVMRMAGPTAQNVAGFPAASYGDHEAEVYRELLAARALNPTETMALVGYFRERARTLVAKHWKAISTLAAVLVEVPELTGEELDDTINKALAAETEPAHKEIAA